MRSAIHESRLAVEKNPVHPALLSNLAVLYFEDGQKRMAQRIKARALAAAPESQRDEYKKKFEF
jgi:hypothetical protein